MVGINVRLWHLADISGRLGPCPLSWMPGDSADGSFLHDANCLGCHDTGIYTRKDRRIRSLDALKGQLANCSHMANQQFSAIEMQNIIKYLNDQFYQFR